MSAIKDVIRELQMVLNAEGAIPLLTVDGIFGPKTEAALKAELNKKPVPSTGMRPIDCVRGELGQKEVPGSKDNPRIQQYLEACDNIGGRDDDKLHHDEVPWCSALLNWVAEQCGMEKTNNALAASWDKYGEDSGDLVEEGDIVTIAHPGRHVTLANKAFNRKTDKIFEGIGGNQSNTVKVSVYNTNTIRAARKWKPRSI